MNSTSRRLIQLVALFAMLAPGALVHAQNIMRDVYAGPVFRTWVDVPANSLVVVESSNLSAGADTVVHLWDPSTQTEVAYNDDWNGLSSLITYNNPNAFTKTYMVLVRSYSTFTTGTANLVVNTSGNNQSFTNIPVGGSMFFVSASNYTESVLIRSGSGPAAGAVSDTVLYGFDSASHMVAFDDDGGVGYASALLPDTRLQRVILAPYWPDGAGTAHLYSNDINSDADSDGVGNAIESALGTCASSCPGVVNPKDTDRDGISDRFEVFGYEGDDGDVLYFGSWGANPRHKDLYVDVDWDIAIGANPVDANKAIEIANAFAGGSAADLGNTDGQPGVSVHVDNGIAAPAGEFRYGDFGGSTAMWTYRDCEERLVNQSATRQSFIRQAFGYVGNGGQTPGFGTCFGWGMRDPIRTFIHELGHTLKIDHHGVNQWGALNCKPNYRSVMNYTWQFDASVTFSNGSLGTVLNPASVVESTGIGQSPAYLATPPFSFSTQGNAVDWDRDGTFQTQAQRAGLTHLNRDCGALAANTTRLADGTRTPWVVPSAMTTPALVKLGSRLYAFWVGNDDRLRYRQGALSSSPANGSCPNGAALGTQCMTWNAVQTVATTYNVGGFSATVMSNSIVLAYRAIDPAGTNTNLIYVKSSTGVSSAGNVSGWTADASRGVRTVYEPEIDLFTINAGTFGTTPTQVLALFYRSTTNNEYRWMTATGPTGTWTDRNQMRDANGAIMTGGFSPTVAARGSGTTAEYCGVFPDNGSLAQFHCFDRSTSRWRWANAFGVVGSKAGLAFHTRRKADGTPLTAAKDGQWYIATVEGATDAIPTIRITTGIAAANTTPNTGFTYSRSYIVNVWDRQQPGAGIPLFEDETVGSMKALKIWVVNVEWANPGIDFLPFVDGTPNVQLKDGSDWRLMARGICENLRGSSYCGAADPVTGY